MEDYPRSREQDLHFLDAQQENKAQLQFGFHLIFHFRLTPR